MQMHCFGTYKARFQCAIFSGKLIVLSTLHDGAPSGIHFTAESTDAMRMKCLA